jgi:hypothetical protein
MKRTSIWLPVLAETKRMLLGCAEDDGFQVILIIDEVVHVDGDEDAYVGVLHHIGISDENLSSPAVSQIRNSAA